MTSDWCTLQLLPHSDAYDEIEDSLWSTLDRSPFLSTKEQEKLSDPTLRNKQIGSLNVVLGREAVERLMIARSSTQS